MLWVTLLIQLGCFGFIGVRGCAICERLDQAGLQLDALTSRMVRLNNMLDGVFGDNEQHALNIRSLLKKLDQLEGE